MNNPESVSSEPDAARGSGERLLKMFVWKNVSFLAAAHAYSVAEARALLLATDLCSGGDGSCPERDAAREVILKNVPCIWYGPNAEFAITDSAEVREYEHNFKTMGDEIERLKAELAAVQSRELSRDSDSGAEGVPK